MPEMKMNQDAAPQMITIVGREYQMHQAGQKAGSAQALRECSENMRRAEDHYGAQFAQLAKLLIPHVQNLPDDDPTKMAVNGMEATVRGGFRVISTQFSEAATTAQAEGSHLMNTALGMASSSARDRARLPVIVKELLYISAIALFWHGVLFAILSW